MLCGAIKNEDKTTSLTSIAKLYSYIPKYASVTLKNGELNAIYETKSNILKACAMLESNDLGKAKDELTNAEKSFMPIINNINSNTSNQANINKAYIIIKEMQNIGPNIDKDIFYIKYKNLMQELDNIKG